MKNECHKMKKSVLTDNSEVISCFSYQPSFFLYFKAFIFRLFFIHSYYSLHPYTYKSYRTILLVFISGSVYLFNPQRASAQNEYFNNQLLIADRLLLHDSTTYCFEIASDIRKQAESLKDKYTQAQADLRLGCAARAQNNNIKAAQHFESAADGFKELKLPFFYVKALAERGVSELRSQKRLLASDLFYSALKVFNEDLSIQQKTENLALKALICERLATLLSRQSFNKAENFAFEAIEINEKIKDDFQLNVDYTTLGNIYHRKKDWEKSQIYYKKSFDLCKKNNFNAGRALVNLGNVDNQKNKYPEAIALYNDAIKEYEKKSGNEVLIAQAYINLASTNDSLKRYDTAINYLLKSIRILNEAGSTNGLKDAYDVLIDAYKNTGQTEKALQSALLYNNLQQSEFQETQSLADNQSLYENKKIEKEAGDKFKIQQEQMVSLKKQQELQIYNQKLLEEKDRNAIDLLRQGQTLRDFELKRKEDTLALANNKLVFNAAQLKLAETDKKLNEQKVKTQRAYTFLLLGLLAAGLLLGLTFWQILRNRMRHEREKAVTEQLRLEASILRNQLESEIKLLRAQMNPHFIFNSLNSINNFLLHNDTLTASQYLTRFSKLVRLVLDNARTEKITLKNELDTLELYMQFEALRFEGKIKYQIQIDPAIATEDIRVPPLLIQPYVENSIWHGLMQKEYGGNIKINVSPLGEDAIYIDIEDDGVGREASFNLKSKSATKNKTHGMQITAERVQLLDEMYKTQTHITVDDLFDIAGKPRGTKVRIEIPI